MVEEFLLDLHRRNYSPQTLRTYGQTYSDLMEFAGGKFDNLIASDLRRFLSMRGEMAPATRNRHIAALKSLGRFMQQVGKPCPFTVAAQALRGPRQPLRLPRAPTEDQAAALISAASRARNTLPAWQAARMRAAVLLLYGVGLRSAEMLSLAFSVGTEDMVKVTGKGGRERLVHLLPVVLQAVQNYKALWLREINETPALLFDGFSDRDLRRTLEMLREECGLPDTVTPHALRHGFATHIYQNGGDIRTLADVMGHKSVRTTALYMAADANHLLKVVQNCRHEMYGEAKK